MEMGGEGGGPTGLQASADRCNACAEILFLPALNFCFPTSHNVVNESL